MKTHIRLGLISTISFLALYVSAQGNKPCGNHEGYRLIELQTDTLPSLNTPRTGHVTLCLDGEVTVFGGHTEGFVPTPTAEYFRDGAWHTVAMAYPHDDGIALELRSGKVFLAGGHKDPLGIGQLFSAELYDPVSHISQGFGCMAKKRAFPNAIEMADGQVVIAGNWYADDEIEMFENVYDPLCPNAVKVKDTTLPRGRPYILRISDDDAIIFGTLDNENRPIDPGIVDRLKGPSYREPFLETWKPIRTIIIRRSSNNFIGNEAENTYEWLIPVENKETGQVAIALVKGNGTGDSNPAFSLLPTKQSLPDSINGRKITYSSLVCDRQRKIAYLIGENDETRIFVVAIPYDPAGSSDLTVYMTGPQPIIAQSNTPVLTPGGDLVFAGGHLINNFAPSDAVIRVPLSKIDSTAVMPVQTVSSRGWVLCVIIILCILVCAIAIVALLKRNKRQASETPDNLNNESTTHDQSLPKEEILAELFRRIELLMDKERLYLNPNLRASDVAARVGSNTAYVSAAINSQCGCSFSQFLIKYRILHAQELMRRNPDSKISTISAHSGFSSDSTFFRVFRYVTGMTPKEWLSSLDDGKQS